jgi:hypothetical protein
MLRKTIHSFCFFLNSDEYLLYFMPEVESESMREKQKEIQ